MDVNIRCWILITFAAFFSAKLREVMADGKMVRKQLHSKTGFTLAILEDGNVTTFADNIDIKYTYTHMNSHAKNLVTIKGEETGYYICMDDKNRIYGSKNITECEFVESLTEDNYTSYHRSILKGNVTQNMYLAINRRGHVKSVSHQRSSVKFNIKRTKS